MEEEKKMKTITISLYAVERRIDVLDDEGDPLEGESRFTTEDFMEWTVEDNGVETEYSEEDFGDFWDLENADEISDSFDNLDVNEFIERVDGAAVANLETLKSSGSIQIEIPEGESFDPKKFCLVTVDWIFDEYEECMLQGFVYDGKYYDELYPEDGRGIDSEEIWSC
ncbi:MAG: hypothetical protein NC102_02500 [Clostridium sp.]|nr:hypothetical protein [Clostridium sp.]